MPFRATGWSGGLLALALLAVAASVPADVHRAITQATPTTEHWQHVPQPATQFVVHPTEAENYATKKATPQGCATLQNRVAEPKVFIVDASYAPHCLSGCAVRLIYDEVGSQVSKAHLLYTGAPC